MRAKQFVFYQQQNLGRIFGICKMHFSPPGVKAAVHSNAMVMLLLIHC